MDKKDIFNTRREYGIASFKETEEKVKLSPKKEKKFSFDKIKAFFADKRVRVTIASLIVLAALIILILFAFPQEEVPEVIEVVEEVPEPVEEVPEPLPPPISSGGGGGGGSSGSSGGSSGGGGGSSDSGNNDPGGGIDEIDIITPNESFVVNIVSPHPEANYGFNESLELNFTLNDTGEDVDSCWYFVNGVFFGYLNECGNETFDVTGAGVYNLSFFANLTNGYVLNGTSIDFAVTLGAPDIFPIELENIDYVNYTDINLTYIPEDPLLDICQINGFENDNYLVLGEELNVNNFSLNNFSFSLSPGNYNWSVFCNNSNQIGGFSLNRTFTIDLTNPIASISSPPNNFVFSESQSVIDLDFSCLDASPCLGSAFVSFNGSTILASEGHLVEPIIGSTSVSEEINVTEEGTYIFDVLVIDFAGNSHEISRNFSFDLPCNLENAYWGNVSIVNGTGNVSMNVEGTNCILAENVTFDIYKNTTGQNEFLQQINETMINNVLSVNWTILGINLSNSTASGASSKAGESGLSGFFVLLLINSGLTLFLVGTGISLKFRKRYWILVAILLVVFFTLLLIQVPEVRLAPQEIYYFNVTVSQNVSEMIVSNELFVGTP